MATIPAEEEEEGQHQTMEKINFQFEDGTYSIGDIIFKFPLPVVGVSDTTKCPLPVEKTSLTVDLRQPLLFYRKRNIQKVPARSLYFDEETKAFEEVGDPLLIPEDYKGYFAILTRRGISNLSKDQAPHFSTIEDVAASNTTKFLIGGQNRVQGYAVVGRKGENVTQQERKLFPGDVLRKGKVLVCETKVKKGLLRRNSIVSEKYLSCIDNEEREIIIPFSETGFFYALSVTSGKITESIMQMSDIVAQKCLPCVAKLVYGRVPSTPCSFSGLLKLDKAYLEQSVIASTIMNLKNILIEIPSSCDMSFHIAMSNNELCTHKGYNSAMELCGQKIFTYMRNMKVCHRVAQDAIDRQFIRTASEDDNVTASSPITVVSQPLPCSKYTQRDSGYIPMSPASSCADGIDDGKDYIKMTAPESAESIPPKSSQRQLLKLYVNNSLMEIPVYNPQSLMPVSSEDTVADDVNDQPPTPSVDAPPPCMGPTPKPCSGSPSPQDSGISDDGMMNTQRRPSTFIFAESDKNKDDDIIYDTPVIPTQRRESAPPSFETLPGEKKPECPPRLHRSATFTSSKQKKIVARDLCSNFSETIHEHYEGCEHDEMPQYENIEGLRQMRATLERHQTLAETDQVCFPWHQSASDSYLQRFSYGSSQASGETSTSNSGPTTPAVTSNFIETGDNFDDIETPPPVCAHIDFPKENPLAHSISTDNTNYTLPTSPGPTRTSSETSSARLSVDKTETSPELDIYFDPAIDDEESPPAPHVVKKDGYSEIPPSPHNVDSDGYAIPFTLEDQTHPYFDVVSDHTEDSQVESCVGTFEKPTTDSKQSTKTSNEHSDYSVCKDTKPKQKTVVEKKISSSSSSSDVFLDSGEEIPKMPSMKPHHQFNTKHKEAKPIPPIPQRKPSSDAKQTSASVTEGESSTGSNNTKLKRREHCDSSSKSLNVEELDKALKECGVKQQSRDYIRKHVSFDKLLDMNADDLSEDLPGVGLTDLMKISMFIRTWRLQHLHD